LETHIQTAGFEVLTSVVMKSFIFWDITLCGLLEVNGILGEHVASIYRATSMKHVPLKCDNFSTDYMALNPSKQNCSYTEVGAHCVQTE
jgi:hypothetical protein